MRAADRIRERLLGMQDSAYREFMCRLLPNVEPENVIGVRTPALRAFAKELQGTKDAQDFLMDLPHAYYEENNLHGFLIVQIREYDECIEQLNRFLPYVDNWATCDGIRPKCFQKHPEALLNRIRSWLSAAHPYTVRFGMEMLMVYYLDEAFDTKYPEMVAAVHSDEYYVKMMIAWYFQAALVKQYDNALPYLQEHRLDKWVHNKAIQKAIESYCMSDAQKAYLRTLKR